MDRTLEDVRADAAVLRAEERRLESAHFRERIEPALRDLLGKAFVWRDNSSGDGPKFDSFRLVRDLAFTEYHAYIISEQCEVARSRYGGGHASIETSLQLIGHSHELEQLPFGIGGWSPCSVEEYVTNRERVEAELTSVAQLKADLERDAVRLQGQ